MKFFKIIYIYIYIYIYIFIKCVLSSYFCFFSDDIIELFVNKFLKSKLPINSEELKVLENAVSDAVKARTHANSMSCLNKTDNGNRNETIVSTYCNFMIVLNYIITKYFFFSSFFYFLLLFSFFYFIFTVVQNCIIARTTKRNGMESSSCLSSCIT